jgi:DNA-binding NarL/FixJ family response regulator
MSEPIRILVVEDDGRMRNVIGQLLAGGQFAPLLVPTAAAALAQLDAHDPHLVLVDLGLPDLDGVELIAQIVARRPRLPSLVLTVASTEERIRAALRAGARGYLFKEDLGRRLLVAIDEALHGGVPMSKAVAELLLAQVRGEAPPKAGTVAGGPLTTREREVLERLSHSLTYEETAADLGVSVNTVRSYVRAIYDKLEVSTRTEAVIAALELGLLPRQ